MIGSFHVSMPARWEFVRSCAVVCGTFIGVAAVAGNTARADAIDVQFYEEAPQIIKYLKTQGYSRVGVLNFRVQSPGKPPTFMGGSLSVSLAERLENALVMNLHERDKIVVIHNAGDAIASQGKKLSYLRKEDCRQMFGLTYPPAWGWGKVSPDVFLTGTVSLSESRGGKLGATVTIKAINRDLDWDVVCQVPLVAIDSAFLTELGRARSARAGAALADFDDVNAEETKRVKEKTEVEPKDTLADSRLDFQVKYGDAVQTPRFENGCYTLPDPSEVGARVRLMLRNKQADPIGVVVLVNGLNTLQREVKKDYTLYRKWICEPDKQYELAGYYDDKTKGTLTNDTFVIVSDQDFEAMSTDLPNAGKIEVYIFVKGTKISQPNPDTPPSKTIKISMRGLAQNEFLKARHELTLDNVKRRLVDVSGMTRARGGILSDGVTEERPTEYASLPDPVRVEYYCFIYKQPKQ